MVTMTLVRDAGPVEAQAPLDSCGDSFLNGTEECDYNGVACPNPTDTCSDNFSANPCTCMPAVGGPVCGNGVFDDFEQCDTSGMRPGVTCPVNQNCNVSTNCICDPNGGGGPVCGDAFEDVGEECDDGNTLNGDGCSDTCFIEDGFGFCCVPSVSASCLPQIPLTLLDPQQIQLCKDISGIHYDQDNEPVCTAECRKLGSFIACNPNNYTCGPKKDVTLPLPPGMTMKDVKYFPDTTAGTEQCNDYCIEPIDVQGTIGCMCADAADLTASDNGANSKCVVTASIPPGKKSILSTVKVTLTWTGKTDLPVIPTPQSNGKIGAQEFVPAITPSLTPTFAQATFLYKGNPDLILSAGEKFEAVIYAPGFEDFPASAFLDIATVTPDPVPANNTGIKVTLPSADYCNVWYGCCYNDNALGFPVYLNGGLNRQNPANTLVFDPNVTNQTEFNLVKACFDSGVNPIPGDTATYTFLQKNNESPQSPAFIAIWKNACEGTAGSCGNGIVDAGEQCEPPNTATCNATCQTIVPPPPPNVTAYDYRCPKAYDFDRYDAAIAGQVLPLKFLDPYNPTGGDKLKDYTVFFSRDYTPVFRDKTNPAVFTSNIASYNLIPGAAFGIVLTEPVETPKYEGSDVCALATDIGYCCLNNNGPTAAGYDPAQPDGCQDFIAFETCRDRPFSPVGDPLNLTNCHEAQKLGLCGNAP